MQYAVKLFSAAAASALLVGCGTLDGVEDNADSRIPAPLFGPTNSSVSDYPQKIGEPYQVAGKTYTPEDVNGYDEVGYASWYGRELAGNATANGEAFNPQGISAAHKTLPLPTYVEVTALDTGRTILVRVNDRGPFANDRLIDLSHGAAKQLGIDQQGVAGVRVRKVNPNGQERAVLRGGGPVMKRIATPDSLLSILRKNLAKLPRPSAVSSQANVAVKPGNGASYVPPAKAPVGQAASRDGRFIVEGVGRPSPATTQNSVGNKHVGGIAGSYVVQVAAFGNKSRADALARKIGAKVMGDGSRRIWRVRYGPYANQQDAQAGLAQAKKRGYSSARILRADK